MQFGLCGGDLDVSQGRLTLITGTDATARIDVMISFAALHFESAKRFRDRAKDANSGLERYELVLSAVTLCVAAAEAAMNELIGAIADGAISLPGDEHDMDGSLAERRLSLLDRGGMDRLRLLDKFNYALTLVNAEEFSFGAAPLQDVAALIGLRNALVHARFRTDSDEPWEGDDQGTKLLKQMRSKFDLDPDERQPSFPFRLLSRGCATWAVDAIGTFLTEFFSRVGAWPYFLSPATFADDQQA